MTEPLNPFQPPKSELEVVSANAPKRMFSPNQALGAAFLGGPFAATYVIRANYEAMGNTRAALRTLLIGGALSLLLIGTLPFIPSGVPNQVLPLAYSFTTRYVVQSFQMSKTKIASTEGVTFQPNGRVVAIGLVGLVAFLVLALAVVLGVRRLTGAE